VGGASERRCCASAATAMKLPHHTAYQRLQHLSNSVTIHGTHLVLQMAPSKHQEEQRVAGSSAASTSAPPAAADGALAPLPPPRPRR